MIETLIGLAVAAQAAPEPPPLRSGLEPLSFLVGHCWEGEFAAGERDRHCFEAVYGGQHVRDRHEVTGARGVYRGETLFSAGAGGASFTYWNSLGGVSRGTMRADADRLVFSDETYRGPDGREVRVSTHWRPLGDAAYESVAESADSPSLNRTVRYRRVEEPVAVSETRIPDGTLMLVHETVVDAPLDQVWRAVSTAEGWREWAVPLAWSSADQPDLLETSYDPTAQLGDASTIRHRVLAEVPGRLIAFRTVKAPDGFPHFDVFGRTTSAFELEAVGESRTRVRVVSAGYPDDEAGRQLIGFFRDGNRTTLERLRDRFVSGPRDWSR